MAVLPVEHVQQVPAELVSGLQGAVKPLPQEVRDALSTVKFWLGFIAAALAVIALLLIGISLMFARKHEDSGDMVKQFGKWIAGVVLVATASGIAAVFLP